MKTTIIKKLLGLTLSVFSITAAAQCPTVTNMSVAIGANGTATVTPLLSASTSTMTMYYWSVTPSATQTSSMWQASGVFQFPANGSYTLSVSINDSINGCWLTGNTALNINNMNPSGCNASFTAYTDSNCVTHFVNSSSGNSLTYQWYDMSNGSSSIGNNTNPTANLSNGNHLIGLFSYSNGSFCDSITKIISVNCSGTGTTTSCQASFYTYTDSSCITHFINNTPCTYSVSSWNINGTMYYTSSPALNLTNGSYVTTLNTSIIGSGISSSTNTVNIACNSGTTSTCQASFYTYTDSLCVTHFINTSVTFGGSNSSQWNINGNVYTTSDVALSLPNGYYNASLFNYSNGMFCDSISDYVNVSCGSGTTTPAGCQADADFYVFADSSNAGNYFAYNLSTGTGNISYLWNFGDGTTSTQQYPFHQYAIPGQYVICLTISATSGTSTCTDSYCDSSSVHRIATGYLMSQMNVIPQTAAGVKQAEVLTKLNTYPNPMADELTIETITKDNSKLNYRLIDALGRIVLTGTIENSKATINTSSLEKGFYSLNITDEKGSSLKAIKLVK